MLKIRSKLQFGWSWLGHKTPVALISLCSLAVLALLTSCDGDQDMAELVQVVTSDHWSKELGQGMLRERYVYTFETNGTYKACVFSDYGTRPIRGKWRLTTDQESKIHLRLDNEEAYYYCLWRDSVIRYDKKKDALVVSGPHYNGEMELQRTRGKRSDAFKPRQPFPKHPFPPMHRRACKSR